MAQSKFRIYLGGLEATPITKEVNGRFLVLSKKEVGAKDSFTAFAIKPTNGVDELLPLELASTTDSEPYYVIDKEVSLEYLVYSDSISSKEYTQEASFSRNVVDLTDDQATSNGLEDVIILNDDDENMRISTLILDINSPKGILQKMLADCQAIEEVSEIPEVYNGDVAYELPPVSNPLHSPMSGMEQSYDGHVWMRPFETHVKFPGVVRKSTCGGAFECVNALCGSVASTGSTNQSAWKGKLHGKISRVGLSTFGNGTLSCFYCKCLPTLRAHCEAHVYYVLPKDNRYTRLMIHQGHHNHEVQRGTSRTAQVTIRNVVRETLSSMGNVGARKIQMEMVKKLALVSLQRNHVTSTHHIGPEELYSMLQQMYPLIQGESFKKVVKELKNEGRGKGDESQIIDLKRQLAYEFVHGSRFPGQALSPSERCYVFKMSTKGPASGLDLINRMRRSGNGDLRRAWVCFDHVRRVRDWTTMAAHVYDPSVQDLMTIATCEMKEEDTDAQSIFWQNINDVVKRHGFELPDFFGFMADEAGANWKAIRTVYNEGKSMGDRERSCLFHWEQSLVIHTDKYIFENFKDEHKLICRAWRCANSEEEALEKYYYIRAWWASGKVADANIPAMDCWLSWWHIRYPHWRRHIVGSLDDKCYTPQTNLAEVKHASWLAGEGFKGKIGLYDATISDLGNNLLQQSKRQAYLEGKYIGRGPGIKELRHRAESRSSMTPTPSNASRIVDEAVRGTNMHQAPIFYGDNETVTKKRQSKRIVTEEENSSHRPDLVTMNVPRKQKGRRLNFQDASQPSNLEGKSDDDFADEARLRVKETEIANEMWAIRRTNPGSKVSCQGILGPRLGKCKKAIGKGTYGIAAPSFEGLRVWDSGTKKMWVWCCNSAPMHTYNVDNQVIARPPRPPLEWPVAKGTNLTSEEINAFRSAGFHIEMEVVEESGVARPGRYRAGISEQAAARIEKALRMDVTIHEIEVIRKEKHEVFVIATKNSDINNEKYRVSIAKNPGCTCKDFQIRVGEGKAFIPCKHMYFIYLRVCGMDMNHNMFIHQPSLTEVQCGVVLRSKRAIP